MTETQNSVRLGEIIKEFHLELLHEGEDYQNIPLRTLDAVSYTHLTLPTNCTV